MARSEDREEHLIERIGRKLPVHSPGLRIGIGDDAAILLPSDGLEWVVTTDAFLENVHFLRQVYPPRAAGHKAVARATSDIAAMGARARFLFLTLGLPDSCLGAWLDAFLDGMARAARRYGLTLAGGDTTIYPVLIASLTVLGEIERGRAVFRTGARPGDLLCVSGGLGEAQLGLELVLTKLYKQRRWAGLLQKHFWPEPRLVLGQWLARNRMATAMIDTSDGFSTDLHHICEASGVGAKVWAEKIPVVRVPLELQHAGFDPLKMALHGGEDYELLFTAPKRSAKRLPQRVGKIPLTVIGEITREKKVVLIQSNGRRISLKPEGWDPFRKKA